MLWWGFSLRAMGRPLAEMADESIDNEQYKERAAKLDQKERAATLEQKREQPAPTHGSGTTDAKKAREV